MRYLQILKPAFTILIDRDKQSILLLIRGTHSIRDTLTAATGAVVPFHHTIVQKGGVSDLVLGYAHFGMVAAARWIAKLAAPCLTEALHMYPDYKIKVLHTVTLQYLYVHFLFSVFCASSCAVLSSLFLKHYN